MQNYDIGMENMKYIIIFIVTVQHILCMITTENVTVDSDRLNHDKNSSIEYFQLKDYQITKFQNITEESNTTTISTTNVTKVQQMTWTPEEPEKELPFAIIVAGPTAAFIVIVFLCVAFYFHNVQLNKNAHKISLTLYVEPEENSDTGEDDIITPLPLSTANQLPIVPGNITSSPSNARLSRNLSTVSVRMSRDNSFQTVRLTREPSSQNMRLVKDSDIMPSPKKSTVSLGLPSRGSILSAFADQEIVNQSLKRKHSIFFI